MTTAATTREAGDTRLFTPTRQREAARIVLVAVLTALYWRGVLPFPLLLLTLGLGLYPLAKSGFTELWRERRVGTELLVTVATIIAFLGEEYVAAAVLMTVILIAEYIADFNTDRARASIKALIAAAPLTATVRTAGSEQTVPVESLTPGSVVLVRAGDRIPVDGTVTAGTAAVNEASITGESVPVDRATGESVLAGTIVESGALDVRTEKVGPDTLFARIVALVEDAESETAPVQIKPTPSSSFTSALGQIPERKKALRVAASARSTRRSPSWMNPSACSASLSSHRRGSRGTDRRSVPARRPGPSAGEAAGSAVLRREQHRELRAVANAGLLEYRGIVVLDGA